MNMLRSEIMKEELEAEYWSAYDYHSELYAAERKSMELDAEATARYHYQQWMIDGYDWQEIFWQQVADLRKWKAMEEAAAEFDYPF